MRSSFHCSCVPLCFHQLPPQYHSGMLDHVIASSISHFVRVRGPPPVRMRTWRQANAVETIKSTFMLLWCRSMFLAQRRLLLKKIGCPFPLPPSASPLGAGLPTSRAETLLGYDAGGLPNARSCRVPAVESCKKLEVIFCVGEKSLWNTAVRNAAWPEPSSGSCDSPYKGV
ncbi:unnamed protein product [Sphagnum jensenii]